jgi:hypothetical protein
MIEEMGKEAVEMDSLQDLKSRIESLESRVEVLEWDHVHTRDWQKEHEFTKHPPVLQRAVDFLYKNRYLILGLTLYISARIMEEM